MPNDRNIAQLFQTDIITAYEMLTDFRNGDVLRGQLADLSNISSSIIGKLDEAPNTTTEVRTYIGMLLLCIINVIIGITSTVILRVIR